MTILSDFKTMNARAQVQQLLDFIDASPSPWHVVQTIQSLLSHYSSTHAGSPAWQCLDETACWDLQPGGRYMIVRDDSSVIVLVMGQKPVADTGFKMIGAHTDSPGFRVKPKAATCMDGLLRLGVEIYGGPILATFADRDLSLAGRISYKDDKGEVASQLIQFETPLLRLPNLAIHMNRAVNEDGLKFQKQTELPLVLAKLSEQQLPDAYFSELLQQQSGLDLNRILSWDLAVYDTQKGVFWGADNEFYADSQIDNLASCHAALQALLDESVLQSDSTLVCAFFDHEEIGSESQKGAGGSFLTDVLARIASCTQTQGEDYHRALAKSFMVSADMAHAYQPSFPMAYDPDHKVMVNQGPVVKVNVNHRYSSTGISEAQFVLWCEQAGVPVQKYSHRCDLPCGSTIGPIVSAKLGIKAVDVGNPMWAMHSLRESAGVLDHHYMIKALRQFLQSS